MDPGRKSIPFTGSGNSKAERKTDSLRKRELDLCLSQEMGFISWCLNNPCLNLPGLALNLYFLNYIMNTSSDQVSDLESSCWIFSSLPELIIIHTSWETKLCRWWTSEALVRKIIGFQFLDEWLLLVSCQWLSVKPLYSSVKNPAMWTCQIRGHLEIFWEYLYLPESQNKLIQLFISGPVAVTLHTSEGENDVDSNWTRLWAAGMAVYTCTFPSGDFCRRGLKT